MRRVLHLGWFLALVAMTGHLPVPQQIAVKNFETGTLDGLEAGMGTEVTVVSGVGGIPALWGNYSAVVAVSSNPGIGIALFLLEVAPGTYNFSALVQGLATTTPLGPASIGLNPNGVVVSHTFQPSDFVGTNGSLTTPITTLGPVVVQAPDGFIGGQITAAVTPGDELNVRFMIDDIRAVAIPAEVTPDVLLADLALGYAEGMRGFENRYSFAAGQALAGLGVETFSDLPTGVALDALGSVQESTGAARDDIAFELAARYDVFSDALSSWRDTHPGKANQILMRQTRQQGALLRDQAFAWSSTEAADKLGEVRSWRRMLQTQEVPPGQQFFLDTSNPGNLVYVQGGAGTFEGGTFGSEFIIFKETTDLAGTGCTLAWINFASSTRSWTTLDGNGQPVGSPEDNLPDRERSVDDIPPNDPDPRYPYQRGFHYDANRPAGDKLTLSGNPPGVGKADNPVGRLADVAAAARPLCTEGVAIVRYNCTRNFEAWAVAVCPDGVHVLGRLTFTVSEQVDYNCGTGATTPTITPGGFSWTPGSGISDEDRQQFQNDMAGKNAPYNSPSFDPVPQD